MTTEKTPESHETSTGVGRTFMRLTQYRYQEKSGQAQGLPQPPLELPYDASAPTIALPDARHLDIPALDLHEVITHRETVRQYAPSSISQIELAYLLWCSQGVKSVDHERRRMARTVPSAGARHAFETLLLVNRVDGLAPGLYRYLASAHHLLPLAQDDALASAMAGACMGQQQIPRSAVTFVWVAVLERMYWRYGERGYRYLHLDAGHVCQNLYLAAEPLDCGVCAIAAFYDDEVNALLKLDGESQFAIYLATVGKRQS